MIKWKSVEDLFFNPKVHRLLRSFLIENPQKQQQDRMRMKRFERAPAVTGDEILVEHRTKHEEQFYFPLKLLSNTELNKTSKEMRAVTVQKHQLPPYLSPTQDTSTLLHKLDVERNFLPSDQRVAVVDISLTSSWVGHKDRYMAIRSANGELKTVTASERRRLSQILFPIPGRQAITPSLFSGEPLQNLLQSEQFETILDRACIQFEPNDPEFIRVRDEVFDSVISTQKFMPLLHTRHFGCLVLHCLIKSKLTGLTRFFVTEKLISSYTTLLQLRYITGKEAKLFGKVPARNLNPVLEYNTSLPPSSVVKTNAVEVGSFLEPSLTAFTRSTFT